MQRSHCVAGERYIFMLKKLLISVLLFSSFAMAGCAAVVVGAGTGAGVYSYMNGQLKRTYQASFDKTNRVCITTLKSLKISVTKETSDGINKTIIGKQTDGTPITIKTSMIAPNITDVSVRSGVIGIWNKRISELIHASIANRLQ